MERYFQKSFEYFYEHNDIKAISLHTNEYSTRMQDKLWFLKYLRGCSDYEFKFFIEKDFVRKIYKDSKFIQELENLYEGSKLPFDDRVEIFGWVIDHILEVNPYIPSNWFVTNKQIKELRNNNINAGEVTLVIKDRHEKIRALLKNITNESLKIKQSWLNKDNLKKINPIYKLRGYEFKILKLFIINKWNLNSYNIDFLIKDTRKKKDVILQVIQSDNFGVAMKYFNKLWEEASSLR